MTPPTAAPPHDALPVQGFRGTPQEIERQWLEQVLGWLAQDGRVGK